MTMTKGSCNFDIDRLAQAVNSLQKCLECTICLELMVTPTKTRCGHSFCQACIWKVLRKTAYCPLCKSSLQKRSVSRDDHLEGCIEKFKKLVTAVQIDSHIDILSYSRQPRDTKESCSNSSSSQSNQLKGRELPRKQSTRQLKPTTSKTAKSSTSRRAATDCDNPNYDTNASAEPAAVFKNETDINTDLKVSTWLHFLPDEPSTSTAYLEYEKFLDNNKKPQVKKTRTRRRSENLKKNAPVKTRFSSRLQDRQKLMEELYESTSESLENAESSAKPDDHKRQTGRCDRRSAACTTNSSVIDKQSSADTTWSRVMEFGKEMRKKKRKVKKLNVSTEKNSEKKRNIPQIVDDVLLTPSSRFDLSKNTGSHDTLCNNDENVSNVSGESHNRKRDAIDKNLNSSGALTDEARKRDRKNASAESKTDGGNLIERRANYHEAEATYITLTEGKQIRIESLNSRQMREIIGSDNTVEGCQLIDDANAPFKRINAPDKSRPLEENSEITAEYHDSPSSSSSSSKKKLIVLTPEKLNERALRCEATCEVARTPVGNFAERRSTCSPVESRTLRANNSAEKTEEIAAQSQLLTTPNRSRLSLKRNPRNLDSSLSSQDSSLDKSQTDSRSAEKSTNDRKNVDLSASKNDPPFDRLASVKRDLSSQIGKSRSAAGQSATIADAVKKTAADVTAGSSSERPGTAPEKKSIRRRARDSSECETAVKFVQLGTLIRRRDAKYYYLGKTKRERSMPAEIPVTCVYNMQQSTSKSDLSLANKSGNLTASSNPSNVSQDSPDVTIVKNIRFADNSTAGLAIASENTKLSTALPICNASTSSAPRKDSDHRISRKQTVEAEQSLVNANFDGRSIKRSLGNARSLHADGNPRKTSRDHLRGTITLLSPSEDSQLQFLSADSPVSQRGESSRFVNSTHRQPELVNSAGRGNNTPEIKNSQFAASAHSSENSEFQPIMKTKRTRQIGEVQVLDLTSDCSDDVNSSDSFNSKCTVKISKRGRKHRKNNASADGGKNHRSSSSQQVGNDGATRLDSKEREAHKRKFKRITTIHDSDSESELESSKRARIGSTRNKTDVQCGRRDASVTSTPKGRHSTRQNSDEDRRIRNIVDKWTNEHNTTATRRSIEESGNTQDSVKSGKCSSTGKPASGRQPSLSSNSLASGKLQNARSSQRYAVPKESDLFDSNSIFDSMNLDQLLAVQQSSKSNRSRKSENSADPFNDDIINKVLEIDRSQNNAAPTRNDRRTTSQGDSGNKESGNLLQDNYDEIIANVELPQSDDRMMSRGEQPDRNLNRTLTEQNNSSYRAVTDEPCDVTQETPRTIPTSSAKDIFEDYSHPGRNVKRPPSSTISGNSDKENSVSSGQKKHEHGEERRDKKNITAKYRDVDKDSRRKITSKNNISREKKGTFDRVDARDERVEKEINVSTRGPGNQLGAHDDDDDDDDNDNDNNDYDDNKMQKVAIIGNDSNNIKNNSAKYDSLMDVTQQQNQLQMFEEDLLGVAAARTNRTKTTEMTLQSDPLREQQQCTPPRKRKQSARDKNVTSEELPADEDDVVEKTPETKMKTRRSIAFPSPIPHAAELPSTSVLFPPSLRSAVTHTPMQERRQGLYPLYQSTPKTSIAEVRARIKQRPSDSASSTATLFRDRGETKTAQSARQHPAAKRHLRFVCSGLTAAQIAEVRRLAQMHSAEFVSEFDPGVTHVIVSTSGKENIAKSTLKYLQGIAYRKWVVSSKWADDCIRERRLLSETSYEATTYIDGNEYVTGPRNSRLRDKDLFEDFAFLCVGPYDNVSPSQYQDLLRATGAAVVNSVEELAATRKTMRGVVIQEKINDAKLIEHWYRTARAAPIIIDWVVDCIMQYKLFSLSPYVHALTPQEYYMIGYPRELVEDEDSDMSP